MSKISWKFDILMIQVRVHENSGRIHEIEVPVTSNISDLKHLLRNVVYDGKENFEFISGKVCPCGICPIGSLGTDVVELYAVPIPKMRFSMPYRTDIDYSLIVEPGDIENRLNILMDLQLLHTQDRRLARDALYEVNFDLDRAAEILLTMNGARAPKCSFKNTSNSPSRRCGKVYQSCTRSRKVL
jgi:hypothetical protein